ncbi:NAD(P)-binding protein [Mycena vitilis]|nr:NAD(P)-binding protein [Mycena vitilis]
MRKSESLNRIGGASSPNHGTGPIGADRVVAGQHRINICGTHTCLNFGCFGAAKTTPAALVKPSHSQPEVVLYAVAARDSPRAEAYAKEHGFQKSYGGKTAYRDLIDDPAVDIIYNPLPNGLHFEWTMKALKGGKHETAQIYALAAKKNLVVLEAFHYRIVFHPAIQHVKSILDSKELGAITKISASLTAPRGTAPDGDIRWNYELGGGSTMDPGYTSLFLKKGYVGNVLRYLASSNPTAVLTAKAISYSSRPEHKQIDKMFWATLALENDIIGELHSNLDEPGLFGIIPRIPKLSATVECEGGTLKIFNFLVPHYYLYITVSPAGKPRAAKGEVWWTTYRYQLEAFIDKVQGRTPQTWIEPDDTVANMKWVEEIYAMDGFGSRPASKYVDHEDPKE